MRSALLFLIWMCPTYSMQLPYHEGTKLQFGLDAYCPRFVARLADCHLAVMWVDPTEKLTSRLMLYNCADASIRLVYTIANEDSCVSVVKHQHLLFTEGVGDWYIFGVPKGGGRYIQVSRNKYTTISGLGIFDGKVVSCHEDGRVVCWCNTCESNVLIKPDLKHFVCAYKAVFDENWCFQAREDQQGKPEVAGIDIFNKMLAWRYTPASKVSALLCLKRHLVIGDRAGGVLLLDRQTGIPYCQLRFNDRRYVASLAESPDEQLVACGLRDGGVEVYHVPTKKLVYFVAADNKKGSNFVALDQVKDVHYELLQMRYVPAKKSIDKKNNAVYHAWRMPARDVLIASLGQPVFNLLKNREIGFSYKR